MRMELKYKNQLNTKEDSNRGNEEQNAIGYIENK